MISIFTPTYNRAYILPVLFESLQQQTLKDFEWIIVDDGSTDDTEKVVQEFSKISNFLIKYFKKENQGKHIAINYGTSKAKGDLFFIVDSDDYLSNNAIEILNEKYKKVKDNISISGIAIGYRSIKDNGKILYSKELPNNEYYGTYNDLFYKYGLKGDFATAFKTNVQKEYPYPYFEGETFFRESYVYRKIGKKYKTLYIDDPIYFADYLEDGLTSKSWKMLKKSPKGAALFFKELSNENISIKDKMIALNAYWDFQLNNIKSPITSKLKGVNFFLSIIVLLNKKIKFLNL
jgi:glycosyltransferase involved in cell wall biosynthesis